MKKLLLALATLVAGCLGTSLNAQTPSYGLYQTCQLQITQGQAVAGASVYFLAQPANTASFTPQAQVYSSSTGGAVSQPVKTNGNGQCTAYLSPGTYTVCYVSPYTGTQCLADQYVPNPTGTTSTVSSISIISGGSYTACPTGITFSGGEGSGAAASPVCTSSGGGNYYVSGATVTAGGSYINVPSITFTGGTGSGAAGIPLMQSLPGVTPVASGGTGATTAPSALQNLSGLSLSTTQSQALSGPINTCVVDGVYKVSAACYTTVQSALQACKSGIYASCTIDARGSYNANVAPSITANLTSGTVTSYTINSGGSGLVATAVAIVSNVTVSGVGSACTITSYPTPTITGGVLTGLSGGSATGCTLAPQVQIVSADEIWGFGSTAGENFDPLNIPVTVEFGPWNDYLLGNASIVVENSSNWIGPGIGTQFSFVRPGATITSTSTTNQPMFIENTTTLGYQLPFAVNINGLEFDCALGNTSQDAMLFDSSSVSGGGIVFSHFDHDRIDGCMGDSVAINSTPWNGASNFDNTEFTDLVVHRPTGGGYALANRGSVGNLIYNLGQLQNTTGGSCDTSGPNGGVLTYFGVNDEYAGQTFAITNISISGGTATATFSGAPTFLVNNMTMDLAGFTGGLSGLNGDQIISGVSQSASFAPYNGTFTFSTSVTGGGAVTATAAYQNGTFAAYGETFNQTTLEGGEPWLMLLNGTTNFNIHTHSEGLAGCTQGFEFTLQQDANGPGAYNLGNRIEGAYFADNIATSAGQAIISGVNAGPYWNGEATGITYGPAAANFCIGHSGTGTYQEFKCHDNHLQYTGTGTPPVSSGLISLTLTAAATLNTRSWHTINVTGSTTISCISSFLTSTDRGITLRAVGSGVNLAAGGSCTSPAVPINLGSVSTTLSMGNGDTVTLILNDAETEVDETGSTVGTGVTKITGPSGTVSGPITLNGVGISQSGGTFTFSGAALFQGMVETSLPTGANTWSGGVYTGASSATVGQSPASSSQPILIISTSAAGTGDLAGWTQGNVYYSSGLPNVTWGATYSSSSDYASGTSARVWMGQFGSACSSVMTTDTPACNFAAIRFSPTAGDTYYQCVTGNGSSTTVTPIGTVSPSTTYAVFNITWTSSSVTCTIGSTSVTNTTTLPTLTGVYGNLFENAAASSTAVHIRLSSIYGIYTSGRQE